MAVHGLTENHERGLLASVQYAAKLIRDCEEILAASDRPSPLNRYTGGLTPPQRKILEDYLHRLHQQLLRFLDAAGTSPPPARIGAVHALANAMLFVENALEEMRGRYLRGYGEVSAEAERLLDGAVSEMQAQVREIEGFLTGASADVLRTRLDSLPPVDPMVAELKELDRIITTQGLVDLRASLTLIVDRALETTFEVAVVGRVSSGKSSLLNALVGADMLPTGILPMTAVPTRLRRGPSPAIHVTYAHGRTVSYGIDQLGEFVTEPHNPGNEKRVARVLVDYPSELLPEGVTFVDTPGLGSVASRGALHTFAYLPRCDHAAFLFDATAPLAAEDLGLLAFLREAGITTSVLLSKADLLTGADLQRVQTYVSGEIQKCLGAAVDVRPVSVIPSHASLLRGWIAHDVAPLGTEAAARGHEALVRKVEVLRVQAAAMLEQRTAREPRTGARDSAAVLSRLRDMSAALERTSREFLSFSDRRDALVDSMLVAASEALVADTRQGRRHGEPVGVDVARPAHDEAERVARDLEALANTVCEALADAAAAAGMVGPSEPLGARREAPLITLPPVVFPGKVPPWARVSASLLRRWTTDRLREQWTPALERAVVAYLDVLKRWASDGLAALREEFESYSRPLVAQLSPDAGSTSPRANAAALESDLEWLRRPRGQDTTGERIAAESMLHQE
jgi:GTP-binding protein EngB required for normal cell division